ncbi:MAG TPA: M48 family metalloprotease [Dongiaceae bacterium]|nr:M48 family metalloprotease [Dongiaceae bacterium]
MSPKPETPRFPAPFVIGRRRLLTGSLAVAAGGLLGGCNGAGLSSLDPNTILHTAQGLYEANSLGEKDEIEIGNSLYGRIVDAQGGYYRNAAVQASMERFAAPLIATAQRQNLPWEIVVLDNNEVNAWALPGGKLAVDKGLIRYCASETDLVTVIGHEIGHADLGHGIQQIRTRKFSETLTSAGSDLLQQRLAGTGVGALSGPLLDALQGPITEMVTSGYSREAESEADRNVLKVYQALGYDPRQASHFFTTMLEIMPKDTTATTSLFSTYPGTKDRIAALDSEAASLPAPAATPHAQGWAELKATFPTRDYYRRHPVA